jgi:ATP-dependent helicase/DNAse subunit B
MPLTLVLGPANSAKAGEVLGAFGEAAHRGALLVVPTALDAEHYARELAQRGAVLGSVLTFRGLAHEIARRTGYEARRLSALQRELVLRRVVEGLELGVLARSAEAPGFVGAAGELIAELQRSLITPQRFGQALSAWAGADSRRSGYAEDIARIYHGYRSELDRIGRVDAELYAWRALDALRGEPGLWGSEPVFVYGFDDLTAIERDAIETLCRIVGADVTVSLTYEAGRAALSARAEVVEELRALADGVRELPALDEHYEPSSRAALHHLERFLFEPAAERIDPGDSVRLLEAAGDRAEAELVAAEVIEQLRGGVPADEIVVVYRSLARPAAVVERVFARYGIPLTTARGVPFTHTSLGRSVRALTRCAVLGDEIARAEDLLDYLRTPGLLERPELADALEAEVRREGIRCAGQARERLGWSLEEIDSLRAASDIPAELARHARRLFSLPHRGSAALLDTDEEQDAHALAALLRAVGELEELGLGDQLSGTRVLDLLEELELAPRAPALSGAVLLAEPLAIRARRFRAVFVCGLGEGEFPLPGASEPFLSDEQRHELALSAGLRLAPAESALERERYLFYACLSRAGERIALSYRSSDEEGNLALPSPFIADVADLFVPEWPERRRRRLLADVVWSADEAPTERERALAAAHERSLRGGSVPGPSSDEGPGVRVLGEAALAHVRHSEVVSGGALESFADCPVRWLVERELAPERFDPEPDALTRGSYMHTALEETIARLEGPVTAESLPDAVRILDDVLQELPPTIAAGRPEPVREAMLRGVAADLTRYLEREAAGGAGWEPRGLELRFGFTDEQGSLPLLPLRRGDERAFLRGVIDRVDVDPEGSRRAIVRDYKSGSARPEHQVARWQADRQLQVALYMIAVRELLGLEPVAGLYQPLGGGDLRPRGVFLEGTPIGSGVVANDAREQAALDEVLAEAEERAVELAMELRSGRLEPCPQTCSRDGCRYPGICRTG